MFSRSILALAVLLATHPAIACPPQQNVACNVQYAQPVQRVIRQQVYAAPVVQYQQQAVNYGHAQQFNQHYGYQNQVVVKQLAYAPQQYWSVGAGLQEEAITERIVSKALARLDAKLDAASERIDRRGDDRFSEHPGLRVAQGKCAMCHSEGSKDVTEGGAPKLFTGLGEWLGNAAQAEKAIEAARSGQMPPKDRDKAMLDDDEYLALKQYISQVAGK